jgi:hypothetical protein
MPRAKKKSAGTKTAAKKTTMTKADFVRSLPSDTPAKDVVVKAKAAGITLNEMTVYKTRSLDNKAAGKTKGSKATKGKPGPKPKVAASSASNGAITDFYRVLKRVGVAKAKELIANSEAFQNA